MNDLRPKIKKQFSLKYVDKTFWFLFLLLILWAVVALSSATSTLVYKANSPFRPIFGQILFYLVGILAAMLLQFLPSPTIRKLGYVFWGFALFCLYIIIIPKSPFAVTFNGATRWCKLPLLPQFQPSEIGKLSLIIVVSDLLSRIKTEDDKKKYFFYTLIATGITIFPILVGNFSTAILLSGIILLLWIIARIPWKYILSTIGIALAVLVASYFIVEYGFIQRGKKLGIFSRATTWVSRIDEFIAEQKAPKSDTFVINDDNYQRAEAKIAIANGWPIGLGPGNSKERDYLPLAYADYIFAIIIEEMGLIGAIILIFCYLAILFRACWASSRYEDYGAIYMVMGLALMITIQAMVSMMVAVGIGPVTGQPLPLFTLGGTSVIINSAYFGVMMAVSREQAARRGAAQDIIHESQEDIPDLDNEIIIEDEEM